MGRIYTKDILLNASDIQGMNNLLNEQGAAQERYRDALANSFGSAINNILSIGKETAKEINYQKKLKEIMDGAKGTQYEKDPIFRSAAQESARSGLTAPLISFKSNWEAEQTNKWNKENDMRNYELALEKNRLYQDQEKLLRDQNEINTMAANRANLSEAQHQLDLINNKLDNIDRKADPTGYNALLIDQGYYQNIVNDYATKLFGEKKAEDLLKTEPEDLLEPEDKDLSYAEIGSKIDNATTIEELNDIGNNYIETLADDNTNKSQLNTKKEDKIATIINFGIGELKNKKGGYTDEDIQNVRAMLSNMSASDKKNDITSEVNKMEKSTIEAKAKAAKASKDRRAKLDAEWNALADNWNKAKNEGNGDKLEEFIDKHPEYDKYFPGTIYSPAKKIGGK